MKQVILITILAVSPIACAAGSVETQQARQSLSSYALARCVGAAYPQEPGFTDDVKAAAGAYHFMGRGRHRIAQDEEALEVMHDPYALVSEYMLERSAHEPAMMRGGGDNPFASCLQILWSPEFEALVREQDSYIME